MEKSKKSIITKIILAVGVLFVVISVSLFVKNTWNYMTVAWKAAGLAVVGVICFGVSALFAFKRKLKGMSSVFYYLGTIMVGAFILMLGGGINSRVELMNKGICLLAAIVVSMILAIRTVWMKMDFDFAMTVLSMQMIPWLMGFVYEANRFVVIGYTIIYLMIVAAVVYFDQKRSMPLTSGIIYWIQTVYQGITFLYALALMGKNDSGDMTAILCMIGTMLGVNLMYLYKRAAAKKEVGNAANGFMVNDLKACRIMQTLFTALGMICVSVAAMDRIEMSAMSYDRSFKFEVNLVAYAVVMVGIALFGRVEALYIQLGITMLMTIGQADHTDDPYVALIAAIGFGLDLLYQRTLMKRGRGQFLDLRSEHRYNQSICFNTLFGLTLAQLALWLAWFMPNKIFQVKGMELILDGRSFMLVIAGLIWTCAVFVKVLNARRIMYIINMVFMICYLNLFRWNFRIGEDYTTLKPHVITLAFMAAILSLSYIWNLRDKKIVHEIQFWLLTVVFSCDVIYTCVGDIYFLLFFGIVAGIVLLVSAIKSNKRYTILTASCLSIMVVYQTRWFWLSIAWWVYLFVVGVALVTYASVRAWKSK